MENLTTQSMRKVDNVDKVLLVACGSFDPITNMHLRMFGLTFFGLLPIFLYLCSLRTFHPISLKFILLKINRSSQGCSEAGEEL